MTKVPLYYTYALGRAVYAPVTCRCNSRTLPETRGPNFTLPAEIVAALCRFRDLELDEDRWSSHWCKWLDTQEHPQRLPDPPEKWNYIPNTAVEYKENVIRIIKDEIAARLDQPQQQQQYDTLKLGGEGETMLNLKAVEYLCHEFSSTIPITIMTNGLMHDDCAPYLKDWGVSCVSVAFMTHDAEQYQQLMEPVLFENVHDNGTKKKKKNGHERMCAFVQNALACGLQVELTGVDRPIVDKAKAQALATSLGVTSKIRWRSYWN